MRFDKFRHVYLDLLYKGEKSSPRGMETLELLNYKYIFAPYYRFSSFPSRKLNLQYIKDELLWYLRGSLTDLSIVDKAKIWADHVTDGRLFSNYGHYIFRKHGVDYAVECLEKDPDSRRALILILGREHLFSKNRDIPCTVSMGFRIRHGMLHCTVHMRSQDAIFGMGNDVPFFSVVQEMVLKLLQASEKMKDLELGPLTVFVESFHVYSKHFKLLEKIVHEDTEKIEVPRISDWQEVQQLRVRPRVEDGPFSAWLLS